MAQATVCCVCSICGWTSPGCRKTHVARAWHTADNNQAPGVCSIMAYNKNRRKGLRVGAAIHIFWTNHKLCGEAPVTVSVDVQSQYQAPPKSSFASEKSGCPTLDPELTTKWLALSTAHGWIWKVAGQKNLLLDVIFVTRHPEAQRNIPRHHSHQNNPWCPNSLVVQGTMWVHLPVRSPIFRSNMPWRKINPTTKSWNHGKTWHRAGILQPTLRIP